VSEHPTLHAGAGGDTAFRRLIDAFYDRVERAHHPGLGIKPDQRLRFAGMGRGTALPASRTRLRIGPQ
jgi:hypothetical protein